MKNTIQTIAILAICFFSFQTVKAMTGDINGQILEKESNSPVAFAQITFDNGTSKTTVSANEYGYYSVKHLTTGKYQMSVKYNNRTFVMNKVKIQDSYTVGVNFWVSNNNSLTSKVEVEVSKTTSYNNTVKSANVSVIYPVNPAQHPAKAPMAHKTPTQTLMYVNPIKIYSRYQKA